MTDKERLQRKRNAPLTSKYFRRLIMKIREMEEQK